MSDSTRELEALERRMREEGPGRVFLHLAEEYRRVQQLPDAIRVLEEGLALHPDHLGALVALGRCRLELSDPGGAAELLERVIERDPTQMVAYKLLVEAHLELEDAETARQRLRVYALLNDRDPDIAELRRRIGEVERGESSGASQGPAEVRPGGEQPFPHLGDDDARDRYLEVLGPGGLFSDAADVSHGLRRTSGGGSPMSVSDSSGTSARSPSGSSSAGEPAAVSGTSDGAFSSVATELSGPSARDTPSGETLFDLPPLSTAPRGLDSLVAPETPDTSAVAGPAPTVTLGRLYLEQGHVDEAEEIFLAILEEDREHSGAAAGLAAVTERRRAASTSSAEDEGLADEASDAAEADTAEAPEASDTSPAAASYTTDVAAREASDTTDVGEASDTTDVASDTTDVDTTQAAGPSRAAAPAALGSPAGPGPSRQPLVETLLADFDPDSHGHDPHARRRHLLTRYLERIRSAAEHHVR